MPRLGIREDKQWGQAMRHKRTSKAIEDTTNDAKDLQRKVVQQEFEAEDFRGMKTETMTYSCIIVLVGIRSRVGLRRKKTKKLKRSNTEGKLTGCSSTDLGG